MPPELTPQELADALTTASADARTVLANLANYAATNGDVAFALSSGITITVPSILKQVAQVNTAVTAERLAYAQDYAGLPASETVTRDALGRISATVSVLPSGWTITQTLTRDPVSGLITSVSETVTDASATVLYTGTKTLNYSGGRYTGV